MVRKLSFDLNISVMVWRYFSFCDSRILQATPILALFDRDSAFF